MGYCRQPFPSTDGTIGTVGAGCLIVLDAKGNPVETFAGGNVNGPWDMTATDNGFFAILYFTNLLKGGFATAHADTAVDAGTVVRMQLITPPQGFGTPQMLSSTLIGSGFAEKNDKAALIIGPSGVGLGRNDALYVADTVKSRIAAITHASIRFFSAGTGQTVSSGNNLNMPLGLAIAPKQEIVMANAGDGNIVGTTPSGTQCINTSANPIAANGAGSLFGLFVRARGDARRQGHLLRRRFREPAQPSPLNARSSLTCLLCSSQTTGGAPLFARAAGI